MPGASAHPQPRVQKIKSTASKSTTGSPVTPGIPRANGFNGFLRALPGDRALLSPSLAAIAPANLTSASRCQDHTTSPSAALPLVFRHCYVHRIPVSTSVTIAKRPSRRDGMIRFYSCFYRVVKHNFG
jgi:hypothetical protein